MSLPFALVIPWWLASHNILPTSMSSYYYTGMRNLFVGALCAIGIINMCCRGYDLQDTILGFFSGICAIGVAFFPTTPDVNPTRLQEIVGNIHIVFATLLFLSLAYFCLFLFTMTAHGHIVTARKRHRNRIYRACGVAIIASVVLIIVFKVLHRTYLVGNLGAMFSFETTAMFSFGVAWMTKGQMILKDEIARERAAEAKLEEEKERRRARKKGELAGA